MASNEEIKAQLERLEPNLPHLPHMYSMGQSPDLGAATYQASCAISLKRIADTLERVDNKLEEMLNRGTG